MLLKFINSFTQIQHHMTEMQHYVPKLQHCVTCKRPKLQLTRMLHTIYLQVFTMRGRHECMYMLQLISMEKRVKMTRLLNN